MNSMQNTNLSDNSGHTAFDIGSIQPNAEWNIFIAFAFWIVSVLLIVLLPFFALLPYLATQGMDLGGSNDLAKFVLSDPTAVLIQIGMILPAHLITLLLAWLIVTGFGKRPFFESMGWGHNGVKWFHYVLILVGFYLLAFVVSYFLPEQETDFIRMLRTSREAVYLVAILATFSAPIVEEVVYRGVLFGPFQKHLGNNGAIFMVTLLFTLVHVPQYLESLSTIFLLTVLSLTLTVIRAYSNSILPCIILHTIFNGLQSLLLLAEPYFGKKTEEVISMFFN